MWSVMTCSADIASIEQFPLPLRGELQNEKGARPCNGTCALWTMLKNVYTSMVLVRRSLRHNDSTTGLSGLPKLTLAGCLAPVSFVDLRDLNGATEVSTKLSRAKASYSQTFR